MGRPAPGAGGGSASDRRRLGVRGRDRRGALPSPLDGEHSTALARLVDEREAAEVEGVEEPLEELLDGRALDVEGHSPVPRRRRQHDLEAHDATNRLGGLAGRRAVESRRDAPVVDRDGRASDRQGDGDDEQERDRQLRDRGCPAVRPSRRTHRHGPGADAYSSVPV